MTHDSSARKLTALLKLAVIAACIVLACGAGYFVLTYRDQIGEMQPNVVEEHFAEQLEALRSLAVDYPADESYLDPPEGDDEMTRIPSLAAKDRTWWERIARVSALFDDPAIKGATVVVHYPSHATTRLIIKDYKEPGSIFSRTRGSAGVEKPYVSIWEVGPKQFVKYENQVIDGEGFRKSYKIIIDRNFFASQ